MEAMAMAQLHFCKSSITYKSRAVAKSDSTRYSYLNNGKLDKFHRLRTPRAARELSLCVLYSGLVTQTDPLQLLEARMQSSRDPIPIETLQQYDHIPQGAEPIYVNTESQAKELEALQEQMAEIDAAVLTADPYVVYNKFVLSLAQKMIKATWDRWSERSPVVNDLLPSAWKDEKLLETAIVHMAIAEIEALGTSPNIVINEAVELAKRFCDGFAPRIVNGSLGNYFRSRQPLNNMISPVAKDLQASHTASLCESLRWTDEYED